MMQPSARSRTAEKGINGILLSASPLTFGDVGGATTFSGRVQVACHWPRPQMTARTMFIKSFAVLPAEFLYSVKGSFVQHEAAHHRHFPASKSVRLSAVQSPNCDV
jgi:hypothetical protein